MAVTYDNTVKAARMTAVRDQVCGGTSGTLEILHSDGTTVLATFTLTTAGGTIGTANWTLAFSASTVTGAAAGTATTARLKNNAAAVKISGLTVGTSGTDIVLNTTTVSVGVNVTLSSAVITHAT